MRQKREDHGETVSNQKIWSTIRYLDPDTKTRTIDIVIIITLVVILSICLAYIAVRIYEL